MPMGAMPSPAQSKLYAGLLPVELSIEALAARAAELENDEFERRQQSPSRRAARAVARFLIAFYIGVVATLAWQSYGDAARQRMAALLPQLEWLAPQTADSQAVVSTVDEITRSIDRVVAASQEQMAHSVDQLAASQKQITRTVDQLAASQEQVAREIIKLQAVSQYGKNSETPPRPAPAPARNAVQRTSQAR
jgi:methyl-accepting chemotaxis protein